MIGGDHDSVESVRRLFNSVGFPEVVAHCEANGGEIVLSIVMKMQGLVLGLQNQSALYPMPTTCGRSDLPAPKNTYVAKRLISLPKVRVELYVTKEQSLK